ncbi:MAG: hypothetical protein AAB391_03645 [Patescibacteria group bacterium]
MNRTLSFWISLVSVILVATAIIGYAAYRSQYIVRGPIITITYPTETTSITLAPNQPLIIEGTIQNSVSVNLNGRKIYLDEKGDFREQLLLSKGYAIITVKAEDRYQRVSQKTLELMIK